MSPSADQIARTLIAACKAFGALADPELVARCRIARSRPGYHALAALQLAFNTADLTALGAQWGIDEGFIDGHLPVYDTWRDAPVNVSLIIALAAEAAR